MNTEHLCVFSPPEKGIWSLSGNRSFLSLWEGTQSSTHRLCRFSEVSYPRSKGISWWLSGKIIDLQCRRLGFNSLVRKIPWRRKWQPIPGFLPGESNGQRSLAGCSPWGQWTTGQLNNNKAFRIDPGWVNTSPTTVLTSVSINMDIVHQ